MDVPTLDKCPGYNLYIGGFISLRRPKALKNCYITHIVSVLDWKFDDDSALTKGFRHLHIPVDDVEDENLLEWFPRSNAFIQEGLNYHNPLYGKDTADVANDGAPHRQGSGVLIHCAMGKSRSATVLLAYLLWASRQGRSRPNLSMSNEDMVPIPVEPLSVVKALELLRQGRPIAEPNEGFMDQLHMYVDMGCPTTESELKRHKIYRRWMNRRSVEESLRINQAPEMDHIIFEDESDVESHSSTRSDVVGASAAKGKILKEKHMQTVAPGVSAPDGTLESSISLNRAATTPPTHDTLITIKCRKCRHNLATTPFILQHDPPPHRDPNSGSAGKTSEVSTTNQNSYQSCAHIFLHPLSWMREVLSEGRMEGRLTCPNMKCASNVGKFAWTGLRCNCGGWVTPGFGLIKGKVDEVATRDPHATGAAQVQGLPSRPGTGGIRLPPGMAKRGNL